MANKDKEAFLILLQGLLERDMAEEIPVREYGEGFA